MSDDPFAPIDSTCKGTSEKAADAPVAWIAIIPVPDGAPAAFPAHPKLGKPSARWRYTDAAGALLGFACRFDLRNGEKQFRPLTYGRRGAAGEPEWRWESWPPKRPLYGLAELAQGIGMRQKSAITTMLLAPTFFAMHKRHRGVRITAVSATANKLAASPGWRWHRSDRSISVDIGSVTSRTSLAP
jgi:hypothetical protein